MWVPCTSRPNRGYQGCDLRPDGFPAPEVARYAEKSVPRIIAYLLSLIGDLLIVSS
jgi:hypothetical protein